MPPARRTPSRTATELVYTRPWLYDRQREAIFCPERYAVIEASSKAGKTIGCLVWLAEQAMQGSAGRHYWWVAPIYAQAVIAYERLKRGLPREVYGANEGTRTLTLANGAVLQFKGADNPDSLYGEDVYAAVIDEATRCFIAGTPVDTPGGPRPIESLCVGDTVLNAAGAGRVLRTVRKRARSLVVVTVQGHTIVSSPEHRYCTRRGWVEAQHLGPTDTLIRRSAAVRLVRGNIPALARQAPADVLLAPLSLRGQASSDRDAHLCLVPGAIRRRRAQTADAALLRHELLREMAHGSAGRARQSTLAAHAREGERGPAPLLGAGHATDARDAQRPHRAQRDARSRRQGEGVHGSAAHRASSALARRQGAWADASATDVMGGARAAVGVRVCGAGSATPRRPADVLLPRPGAPLGAHRRRGRWGNTPPAHRARGRRAQNGVPAGARVECVEVLQSGDPRFAAYSAGRDTVELYDLAVSGHPSFSVNGFLVHNCKEEAWHAVRSTLTATRGPVRIIGNVKGRKNWAYKLARRAETGELDMRYSKITAHDAVAAGVLDAQEIEDARRQLPENVFRELYLAEPSDDGGNPFGLDAIAACVAPLSDAPPTCWGWDLAKAQDHTVGIGLDAPGRVCRLERWQRSWDDTIRLIRDIVGRTPALVDSTGVGDPVLEALQKSTTNYEGYQFTAPSKQKLMEGLAVAIQQRQITFPDGPIRSELEQFEYVYSRTGVHYSAPAGAHDDCVCALALARQRWSHRPGRFSIVY